MKMESLLSKAESVFCGIPGVAADFGGPQMTVNGGTRSNTTRIVILRIFDTVSLVITACAAGVLFIATPCFEQACDHELRDERGCGPCRSVRERVIATAHRKTNGTRKLVGARRCEARVLCRSHLVSRFANAGTAAYFHRRCLFLSSGAVLFSKSTSAKTESASSFPPFD